MVIKITKEWFLFNVKLMSLIVNYIVDYGFVNCIGLLVFVTCKGGTKSKANLMFVRIPSKLF